MPNQYIYKPISTIDRFLRKVEKHEGGCWLWLASKDNCGYGAFWNGSKVVKVHCWAYEHFVGPIPEGMELDHVRARGCTHRHCVNPAHLEPVTHAENVRRGRNAQREITHCPQGHPYSEENTSVYGGSRTCKTCLAIRSRESHLRRYVPKERTNFPHGETHGRSKLNDDLVRSIRAAAAVGETAASIAARLGVSVTTIDRVIRGIRWKHVV